MTIQKFRCVLISELATRLFQSALKTCPSGLIDEDTKCELEGIHKTINGQHFDVYLSKKTKKGDGI